MFHKIIYWYNLLLPYIHFIFLFLLTLIIFTIFFITS